MKQKYQPKGLNILYEDKDIIVIEKTGGLLTIGTDRDKTRTAHTILNEYVRKGDPRSRNRIYIVHRLDRETSGILVFAKSEQVKKVLQDGWGAVDKRYLTVVHGSVNPASGVISSYLTENSAFRVFSTLDTSVGKLSHTEYAVLKVGRGYSLLEVHLLSGRKHQIRVHFSEKGHPVVGDTKYGRERASGTVLALHAYSLSFDHPTSGKRVSFETASPAFVTRLVGEFTRDSLQTYE